MRALSIRQPWAELILRGIKKAEYRTRRTHIRERVYVYASCKRVFPDDERQVEEEHGIDVDALPRGVLVGTVEIVDCEDLGGEFAWHLARPERAKTLQKPKRQPQPGFFNPF